LEVGAEEGKHTITVDQKQFTFDHVFDGNSTQKDVYEAVGKPMVEECIKGHNVCIFAYGQTGSGKTYSISGTATDPGILPLFTEELFKQAEAASESACVEVAYYEVYKEKAYDLLCNNRIPLRVRGTDLAYLENLTSVPVSSYEELNAVRLKGIGRRATAATLVNDLSSRSHAIFRITFRIDAHNASGGGDGKRRHVALSNCYFVDLAGSERSNDAGAAHIGETVTINASLLALQKVIEAKAEGQSFVNFRDSLLTRLLKECFGGDSMTSLLATLSPEARFAQQSVNTLRLASRAALVVQKPTVHIDPYVQAVKELSERNEQLKAELESLKGGLRVTDWTKPNSFPCLVNVSRDSTLNYVIELTDKPTNIGLFEGAPLHCAECSVVNGELRLKSIREELYVNGRLLPHNETMELQQDDHIAINGNRFLVALIDEGSVLEKVPLFDTLKLEYVESTSHRFHEQLREEARAEFRKDEREFQLKMNEEIEALKRELEEKNKLLSNVKSSEAKAMKADIHDLETTLTNTIEFKQHLERNIQETEAQLKILPILSEEERVITMDVKVFVANIKQMIRQFFNNAQPFVITPTHQLNDMGEPVAVRLRKPTARCLADLTLAEVKSLHDDLNQLYVECAVATDGAEKAETILNGNWNWKKTGVGRQSSIFTSALNASFRQTAQTRRSSLGLLRKGFDSRRSVVTEALDMDTGEELEPPVAVFENVLSFLHRNQRELPSSAACGTLLNIAAALIDKLDAITSLAALRDIPSQNVPQSLSILVQFLLEVNGLRDATRLLDIKHTWAYIATLLVQVADQLLTQTNRWLKAYTEGASTEIHLSSIRNFLKEFVVLVGRLAFFFNENMPDGPQFEKMRADFADGVRKSIDDSCLDVKKTLYNFNKSQSPLAVMVTSLCENIRRVRRYLDSAYDEKIAFSILRPLCTLKEKLTRPGGEVTKQTLDKLSRIVVVVQALPMEEMKLAQLRCEVASDINTCLRTCRSELNAAALQSKK
jgi:hypothetical protein